MEVDNILRDLPNSIIALLFIQNNSNFKTSLNMLTFVAVKFISIVPVYIWGGLGDEGLFRSANILQIADIVR